MNCKTRPIEKRLEEVEQKVALILKILQSDRYMWVKEVEFMLDTWPDEVVKEIEKM